MLDCARGKRICVRLCVMEKWPLWRACQWPRARNAEARHRHGPLFSETILIFPSGREGKGRKWTLESGPKTKNEEQKDWERLGYPPSITSPAGLTNEDPSQRFICSSFTILVFVYLRLNIAAEERRGPR